MTEKPKAPRNIKRKKRKKRKKEKPKDLTWSKLKPFAMVPYTLIYDKRLSSGAIHLANVLKSMDWNKDNYGHVKGTANYFSELLRCNRRSIYNYMNKLIKAEWVIKLSGEGQSYKLYLGCPIIPDLNFFVKNFIICGKLYYPFIEDMIPEDKKEEFEIYLYHLERLRKKHEKDIYNKKLKRSDIEKQALKDVSIKESYNKIIKEFKYSNQRAIYLANEFSKRFQNKKKFDFSHNESKYKAMFKRTADELYKQLDGENKFFKWTYERVVDLYLNSIEDYQNNNPEYKIDDSNIHSNFVMESVFCRYMADHITGFIWQD
jgi:hypothetical protein